MYNEYKQYIDPDLFLHPFGAHGIGHTKRVLYLASKLAENYVLSEVDQKILAVACCYHDIGRVNDIEDDAHGKLSAEKIIRLGLAKRHELSDEELEIVLHLVTMHSLDDVLFVGNERETMLYKMLKDADALDRVRFIGDFDPKYLRLKESIQLIPLAFSVLLQKK